MTCFLLYSGDIIIIMQDLKAVVNEIKMKLPISTYLEREGYNLKPSGANRFMMLCPFHNERTPSCAVPSVDGIQTCYCFGCGEHFDLFSFVEKKNGIPFIDAVKMFADELGIKYDNLNEITQSSSTSRTIINQILDKTNDALIQLYKHLPSDHIAVKEVNGRKIDFSKTCCEHGLGWACEDDSKIIKFLQKQYGYTSQQLLDAGVAKQWSDGSIHFPWHGRIMFPIRDITGAIVGFTGRAVYENDIAKGKYVNSSDNLVYHKRNVLFGANFAKKKAHDDKEIFVVEGQFDVLACQTVGKSNTVAASGTAFTTEQGNMLKRLVTPSGRIVFMFDADEAGQKAASRTFKAVPDIQTQAYATIPLGDKDASDMLKDNPEMLVEQLQNIKPLYQHVINWFVSKYDMKVESDRNAFINDCLELYSTIVDPILADNFITYASLKLGAKVDSLKMKYSSFSKNQRKNNDLSNSFIVLDNDKSLKAEDYILALAVEQPQLRDRLKEVNMDESYDNLKNIVSSGDISSLSDEQSNRLQLALENMRQFDKLTPNVDANDNINELFETQKKIISHERMCTEVKNFQIKNIPLIKLSTTPDNVKEYTRSLREIIEKFN